MAFRINRGTFKFLDSATGTYKPKFKIDQTSGKFVELDDAGNVAAETITTAGGTVTGEFHTTHTSNTYTGASATLTNYYVGSTNVRLHTGGNNALRITSPTGWVQFGSENSSYAHFNTDRSQFYFNRQIEVAGHIKPYTDNTYALGTSSLKWSNVFSNALSVYGNGTINGNLVVGGTITAQEFHTEFVNQTVIREDGDVQIDGDLFFSGSATTTDQQRAIYFSGYDKEGTTDFSDKAFIMHTTGTGGHTGSVLIISSRNDANDGIAFDTHQSSSLKHNGNVIWSEGNALYRVTSQDLNAATRTAWYSNYTSGDAANRVRNHSTVYTLGGVNTLQLSTNTDYDETALWFRQYNNNSSSPNGAGWQSWKKVATEDWVTNELGSIGGISQDTADGRYVRLSGGTLTGDLSFGSQTGTWVASNQMSDSIGWNGNHGVYIGSDTTGASTYVYGDGTFYTGGNNYTIWHAGNDGAGSGLDADTVDGIQASSFLQNSSSEHLTYVYRINSADSTTPDSFGYNNRYQTFNYGVSSGVTGPLLSFGGLGDGYPMQITGAYNSSNGVFKFRTRNGDSGSWNPWREVYHSGNFNPASYLTTSGKAADSNLLDGLDNTQFLRSDANDTATGQYSFTKVNDHAIRVGTIRGTAVGSQTGEYIHLYNNVHIGSPSGWGSRPAPTYGLSVYGATWLATDTGAVGIGTTAPQSGYKLSIAGGGIHMNNNEINYITQLHFNDNVRFLDEGNDSYLRFKYGDTGAGGIGFYDGNNILKGYVYGSGSGFGLLNQDGQWAVLTTATTTTLLHDGVAKLNTTSDGIQILKTGTDSYIHFPAQTNDAGYIRHYESSNVARMFFSVSDDSGTTDYFGFGYSGNQDRFRIYSNGQWDSQGSGTINGNLQVTGNISVSGTVDGQDISTFGTPGTPSLTSSTTNGDGIAIVFTSASNAEYYEIWSSVGDQTNYGLVGKVDPSSVAASMAYLDETPLQTGTIYYRIYAINKGRYGTPLSFSHSFSYTIPDPSLIVTSSDLSTFLILWEPVQTRLCGGYTLKHHATSGTPSESSATVLYTGQNTVFFYNIPDSEVDLNHQFWVTANAR